MFALQIKGGLNLSQRTFGFQSSNVDEFISMLNYYAKDLYAENNDLENTWKVKIDEAEFDWMQLTDDIQSCRKALVLCGLAKLPQNEEAGLLKNAFKR